MATRMIAEVFPAGDFIREELEARGWTQSDLAQIMGRPLQFVNELLSGKKQMTPETALGLAKAFGNDDAMYWMNLDTIYRLARAKPVDDAVSRRGKLYSRFPVRELIKRKWIEPSTNIDVLEQRICRFHNINSIDEEPCFAHAAKAASYDERTAPQIAWLSRAAQLARCVGASSYSEEKLRAALVRLRELLASLPEIKQVPSVLAEAGVRFVIVEFLPGAKIDGAAFWIDTSPVIAVSLRYDRIDNFWFVLRHEIEHVLRQDAILDVELIENLGRCVSAEEKLANEAAAEFLVPERELEDFVRRVRPRYSEAQILSFAKQIGVHPGLVIGRLQFRNELPYTHFRKHLVKIKDIIIETALVDGWGITPIIPTQNAA